jgi:hypothetical protein
MGPGANVLIYPVADGKLMNVVAFVYVLSERFVLHSMAIGLLPFAGFIRSATNSCGVHQCRRDCAPWPHKRLDVPADPARVLAQQIGNIVVEGLVKRCSEGDGQEIGRKRRARDNGEGRG